MNNWGPKTVTARSVRTGRQLSCERPSRRSSNHHGPLRAKLDRHYLTGRQLSCERPPRRASNHHGPLRANGSTALVQARRLPNYLVSGRQATTSPVPITWARRQHGSTGRGRGRQAIGRSVRVAPRGLLAPSMELEVSAPRESNIRSNMAKCQLNRHLLSKSLFADRPHRSSARLAPFTRPHVSQTTKSQYMPSYDSTCWFNTVA